MKRIYQSATKLVFIFLALSFSAATFMGIVEPKDFVTGVMMAFTYYFTKALTSAEVKTEAGTEEEPKPTEEYFVPDEELND